MVSNLRFNYDIVTGEFEESMRRLELPIARTATETMRAVSKDFVAAARAEMQRGGNFGKRFQSAFRSKVFPEKGYSIEAAIYAYSRVPYAGVFEEGASIRGLPTLYLPLPTVPKKIGARRMTAKRFIESVGPLVPMRSKSGAPMLGRTVRLSKNKAGQAEPRISLAALRRGKEGTGILRTVPVFIGLRSVRIPKKFDVEAEAAKARDSIPGVYDKLFRDED